MYTQQSGFEQYLSVITIFICKCHILSYLIKNNKQLAISKQIKLTVPWTFSGKQQCQCCKMYRRFEECCIPILRVLGGDPVDGGQSIPRNVGAFYNIDTAAYPKSFIELKPPWKYQHIQN
jgi:hypothetical protein